MESTPTPDAVARVVALWRYPLKSMRGEDLNAAELTGRGVRGDRAYALIDAETGKVVSAKDTRRWGAMFDCRADFVEPPGATPPRPPVRITLPDGEQVRSDQGDVEDRLSAAFGRPVRLAAASLEESPPVGVGPDGASPEGTFFDLAVVHLLTTATLERLRRLAPSSLFDVRRFRPNVVIDASGDAGGFVEDAWIGRTLAIGPEVRLEVTGPCPRCVMTTLGQSELPKDPAVLRTAAEHHEGNVGVYASVLRGGRIRRGDAVVAE